MVDLYLEYLVHHLHLLISEVPLPSVVVPCVFTLPEKVTVPDIVLPDRPALSICVALTELAAISLEPTAFAAISLAPTALAVFY